MHYPVPKVDSYPYVIMMFEILQPNSCLQELQELTGESLPPSTIRTDEARVDVATRRFRTKGQVAYFDVKVFNSTAKVHMAKSLTAAHRDNEQTKKHHYNKGINNVDQGTMTPLAVTCFGGKSRECTTFYNRLAVLIAEKRNENVATVKNYIRCRLNFCLLRCQLLCMRGSRSTKRLFTAESDDITLITSEGRIDGTK
eukprot:gene10729-biopygen8577